MQKFCRDKNVCCDICFVATNILLSQQKRYFVPANTCLSHRNKTFVATKMILVAAPANDKIVGGIEKEIGRRKRLERRGWRRKGEGRFHSLVKRV